MMPSERPAGQWGQPQDHPGPPSAQLVFIARDIAVRFSAIAPQGFSCIAYDTLVILIRGHVGVRALDVAHALHWEAGHWGEDLSSVLSQILSDFQDEIVEQLRAAWPALPGGAGIAVPRTAIDGDFVQGWYQSEEGPVLRLEPIPV